MVIQRPYFPVWFWMGFVSCLQIVSLHRLWSNDFSKIWFLSRSQLSPYCTINSCRCIPGAVVTSGSKGGGAFWYFAFCASIAIAGLTICCWLLHQWMVHHEVICREVQSAVQNKMLHCENFGCLIKGKLKTFQTNQYLCQGKFWFFMEIASSVKKMWIENF